MSREIKFRGFDDDGGKFVYGWATKLVEGIRRFCAIIQDEDGELTRYYIHRVETIGQYTGLKDKNGKEIYEGDVWQRGDFIAQVVFEFSGGGLKKDRKSGV